MTLVTYPKGTICHRCGTTKKEQRREKSGCGAGYGAIYDKHEWNDDSIKVDEQVLPIK